MITSTLTPISETKAVSVREAAARLGVSERTIKREIAEQRLASFRVRGRRLIPMSAIDDVIAGARGGEDVAAGQSTD